MIAAAFGRTGRLGPKLALLAAGSLLALALVEGSLRAIGFSFRFVPERVEFGYPDPVVLEDRFVADPDLFWVPTSRPRASTTWVAIRTRRSVSTCSSSSRSASTIATR